MKTVLHLERKFTSKTETFIVNQINTIKNYNVIVATICDTKLLPCEKQIITPQNISFISRGAKYLSSKTADDLNRQLKKYKIDLIHTHYLVDAIFFSKLTKLFAVPKICSTYGYDVSSFPNYYMGIPKLFLRNIFKEYDYFLAMSEDMKNDILKLGCKTNKIIVHYYGSDIKRFLYTNRSFEKNGKIKILSVGTIEEKKGQHLVIDALNIIRNNGLQFEYHIIGMGDYLSICKEKVNHYDLKDSVFFHGHIPYVDDRLVTFYKDANIFVLPSIVDRLKSKEGITGTVVEAMASSLPVISTYHAGIPYIIENGKQGLLVKERDADGLARAILELINNIELRKMLGENAQKKAVQELDLYRGTERLEKIYEDIINRRDIAKD